MWTMMCRRFGMLLRDDSHRAEPILHQLGPRGNRRARAPHSERMSALRIQVQLDGNAGLPQRGMIDDRILDWIHGVILRLDQERRRRAAGDPNVGIQREVCFGYGQMSGIESDRKIWSAAYSVGRVDGRIESFVKVGADRRDHVSTRRKSDYSDLVRVEMPLRRVEAHQPNGS